ncbi:hypothetical protein SEA_JACKIEB_68 [Streptomyces phage JackieB]|nr:hypothetical protein SEA_JACKIEB_68 [Streptomyces phage JackieB]
MAPMAARTKTPAKTTEPKAEKKTRTPKPVTDLASATVALNAAKRKADRTEKARLEAVQADADAQRELAEAKAVVKRYYAELMGEDVAPAEQGEPDTYDGMDDVDGDVDDPYEGAGHNAE